MMDYTRFLKIKRTPKLKNNQNTSKKVESGYNIALNHDLVFDFIVYHCIQLNKFADIDIIGGETPYDHVGYGKAGTKLVSRIMGNPGVIRGLQVIVGFNTTQSRPRVYM